MPLTPKQEAFVREYLIDLNAAAAYRRAGYVVKNDNVAKVEGHRLLTNPNIAAAVQKAKDTRARRLKVDADEVVQIALNLARSDLRKLFRPDGRMKPPHEWDDETAAAVASLETLEEFEGKGADRRQVGVTRKLKTWDKNAAVDKLMRHLGLYRDRDGEDGGAGNHLHLHLSAAELRKLPPDELRRLYREALRAPAEPADGPAAGP